MRHTLSAAERLKREKDLDALFRTGKAHSSFPLRALWVLADRPEDEWSPVRICVSAPKKKFRRAHDRNRVKRLVRDVWRQSKHPVYAAVPAGKQLHLMLLYTDVVIAERDAVQVALDKLLPKLTGFLKAEKPFPDA